ncbi:transposase [Escherichia coli]|uniref:Uncharacterized protein n=1 Tax=Escherichia coli TaxID=562 RepID=A0A6M9WUC8_ECOLX|nr:hypothetical protein [Escherichia coli]KHI12652.1 hypothetical protein PU35_25550 [Escherichia coli]MDS0560919.1 hypothetical protein [Escherichia coli]MDS0572505.1 hypothetical protein [Escherichia coli]OEN15028.1 hypothetical protein BHF41_11110 [Escherichia coli]QKN56777.1 hypothetical protein HHJ25_18720 [Escherichia coli]
MLFGSDYGSERRSTVRTERDLLSEWYLRHILSVLPEWPSSRVDELLLHISMEVFGECRTTYSL